MCRQGIQWSIAVYVVGMVSNSVTAILAHFVRESGNKTDADSKLITWETKLEFLLKLDQYGANNGSLLIDLIETFSDPHTSDPQRLVDQSASEVRSLYSDASLPTKLENYKLAYMAKVVNRDATASMSLTSMVEDIVAECERLYVTLSNSSDIKETFVYGVPLAFIHLASLREMFATSEGSLKEDYRKDIVVWLATYWQFISDGYSSWEASRIRGLDWTADMGTNTCNVTFSKMLPKGSQLGWQINQCDPDSSEWLSSKMSLVQTAYSVQLHFEMMASISKIFLLHKLVPGYESSLPYVGNFSTTLKRGPIQPLSYQFVPNTTVVKSVSSLEPACQPLVNSQLTGITGFTVRQWDWVDGVQVQYENGLDDFQGNRRGGTGETMSFDPHDTDKCLSSIKWNLSSRLNRVTSITVAARDGTSTGFLGNKKKTADITIYTTAPMLYCISKVAVCAVTSIKSDNIPAVTGFQVVFDIVNGSTTMPEPLKEGFILLGERKTLRPPNGVNGSSDNEVVNGAASVQMPVRQKQDPQNVQLVTEITNTEARPVNESKENVTVDQQILQQKQEPEHAEQPDNRKQMERMQFEMEATRKKNEEEQRQMQEKYLKMKTDLEESRQRFEAQEEESKRKMRTIEEQKAREGREREQRQAEITEATNNVRTLQNQLSDAKDSLRQWQEKASEGLGFFEGLGRIVTIGYYNPRYEAKENVKIYQGTVDYLTKKLSEAQDRVNRLIQR